MTLHSERGAGTTLSVEVPLTRQEIGVDVSPGDNSIGQRRPEGSIEATQRTVSSGRLRSYTYGGSHPQQQRRPMTQETNDRPPTTTDAGIPVASQETRSPSGPAGRSCSGLLLDRADSELQPGAHQRALAARQGRRCLWHVHRHPRRQPVHQSQGVPARHGDRTRAAVLLRRRSLNLVLGDGRPSSEGATSLWVVNIDAALMDESL